MPRLDADEQRNDAENVCLQDLLREGSVLSVLRSLDTCAAQVVGECLSMHLVDMQTKRQRCLSTTAPQASQVLAVLYNGLNPFSNGRPPATHLSRLSFNQSKSVPGILSGLPSGAAESQSRQAAKVA